jgi:hypothetical protein
MNAFTQDLFTGIIVNGLSSILGQIVSKGRELLTKENFLRTTLNKDPALATILQGAVRSAESSEQPIDSDFADRLRGFLSSPEVDVIVRQIYSSQLAIQPNEHLDSIRSLFLVSLSFRLGRPVELVANLGGQIFDALHKACERALGVAIEDGILSAHEAKSASRHRIILDELAVIKKNLASLTTLNQPSVEAILEFEKKYRLQVGARHAYITPPNFDVARKLPIDDIYVSPDFVPTPKKKGQNPERLEMQDFLGFIYRTVLLGNPGGGKSTFALKLCHDLAVSYENRLVARRQLSPILVVLRDYGAEKKARNCSILQFIESTSNSNYQTKPPPGAFEFLLLNGHVLIVFDGLDELLDTRYRQEISSDVEAFCNLYPSVPVLVTSREVGYEQAPLDETNFEIFRLSPFTEEQVQRYAYQWFRADPEFSLEQKKQKTEAFLQESRIAPDLRSNPLMLALMCNIYRGESYIPRNRPDVYEKCALMLFERWDKMRGINASLPIEAHIRPTMMYLAHWIYAEETLQGGVTEQKLIEKATDYLCPKRFEDRDVAEKAATEFIGFCRGRAWVFTDTGTTKEGERLYQFTHRTFLEYFTAAQLFRTNPTPDSLGSLLLPRIAKREWDVVAQLAFQIQNKNVEGAADTLITRLTKEAQGFRKNRDLNLLSFAARGLQFLVPSPRITRNVAITTAKCCFDWLVSRLNSPTRATSHSKHRGRAEPSEIMGNLLCAAAENRDLIADSLETFLLQHINSSVDVESLAALDMTVPISFTAGVERVEANVDPEILKYWQQLSERVCNSSWKRIERLCPTHRRTAFDGVLLGKVSLDTFTNWHGVQALFESAEYILPPILLPSPAELILIALEEYPDLPWWLRHLVDYRRLLKDAGALFLTAVPPWFRKGKSPSEDIHFWYVRRLKYGWNAEDRAGHVKLTSEELFGAFCLMATMLEADEEEKQLSDWIKSDRRSFMDQVREVFLARIERQKTGQTRLDVDECGFGPKQQELVRQWVRGELNFVGQPDRSSQPTS